MVEIIIVIVIVIAALLILLRTFLKKGAKPCPGGRAACDSQARKASAVTLPDEDKCPEAPDSPEGR
jgi:flagellar basal body-associated protein FliL